MPINWKNNDSNSEPTQKTVEQKKADDKMIFRSIDPLYSIEDIILSEENTEEIKTVINSSKNWDKVFNTWNLKSVIKNRNNLFINLYGAPGTGKTMAAHAIAKSLDKKIICVNYADIESKYVGETSKNLVNLFESAKNNSEVIFFDEADALLSKRVTNMNSSTDVSVNQTRSVLLTLLNDYDGMIIFATNFISNFDSAFMRRIQYHIKFELPNEKMRVLLWKRFMPDEMPTDADPIELAKKYDQISGSDISTAVLKAALKAASSDLESVPMDYFFEAIEKIKQSQNDNSSDEGFTVTKRKISKEEAIRKINSLEDTPESVQMNTGDNSSS